MHFGEPSAEQKRAYTNVLRGISSISTLVFPENLSPAQIDSLVRNPVWGAMDDYEHSTGHGIGAFLSVRECKSIQMIISVCSSIGNQFRSLFLNLFWQHQSILPIRRCTMSHSKMDISSQMV